MKNGEATPQLNTAGPHCALDYHADKAVTDLHAPSLDTQMESFYSDRLPGEPVYDLPTWLEHNYPAHDTQPRSPLYHWATWMRGQLPLEEQRLFLAFDEYMQSERHRSAIVAQANYVSRVWEWFDRGGDARSDAS